LQMTQTQKYNCAKFHNISPMLDNLFFAFSLSRFWSFLDSARPHWWIANIGADPTSALASRRCHISRSR
jgi:hypothetical protein